MGLDLLALQVVYERHGELPVRGADWNAQHVATDDMGFPRRASPTLVGMNRRFAVISHQQWHAKGPVLGPVSHVLRQSVVGGIPLGAL